MPRARRPRQRVPAGRRGPDGDHAEARGGWGRVHGRGAPHGERRAGGARPLLPARPERLVRRRRARDACGGR
eukprot:1940001-Prymnesium_polylepis.1